VDVDKLDFQVRDHLNQVAPRVMCVLRPLKVLITNYPQGKEEWLDAPYYPHDVGREGSRKVPFSRELWIERDDFSVEPPEGFYRMTPGQEVRLRYGYVIRCEEAMMDSRGEVVEVRCTYDPGTRGGSTPDKRRIPGTIHWVSALHALSAEARLYDRLFRVPDPDDVPEGGDFTDQLNPESLVTVSGARIEPSVAGDAADTRYQFERNGYFWRDPLDSRPDALVFNRIVTLRDTWARSVASDRPAEITPARSDGPETARRPVREERQEAPRPSEEREQARRQDAELVTRMARYQEKLGLSREEADILTGSRMLSDLFEDALGVHADAGVVATWVVNELPRASGGRTLEGLSFGGRELGRLIALVAGGKVARLAAKDVLAEMAATGDDPETIVRRRGLDRVEADDTLVPLVESALAEWPDKVREYRAGKVGLLGFFVGQVVRRTEGRGDPARVKALLLERLGAPSPGASR
jgi:glutaminyl-tRNA synthetase